jgi:hypothetical protein
MNMVNSSNMDLGSGGMMGGCNNNNSNNMNAMQMLRQFQNNNMRGGGGVEKKETLVGVDHRLREERGSERKRWSVKKLI